MSTWQYTFRNRDVQRAFYESPRKMCIASHSAPFLDGYLIHQLLIKLNCPDHILYIDGWPHPSWCKNIGRRRNGFV